MLWWDQSTKECTGVPHPHLHKSLRNVIQYPNLDQYIRWLHDYPAHSNTIEKTIHQFYLVYQFHNQINDMLTSMLTTLCTIDFSAIPVIMDLFRSYAHSSDGQWLLKILELNQWDDLCILTLRELFADHDFCFLPMDNDVAHLLTKLISKHSQNENLIVLVFRWVFQMRNEELIPQMTSYLSPVVIHNVISSIKSVTVQDWFCNYLGLASNLDFLSLTNHSGDVLPKENDIAKMNVGFYDAIKQKSTKRKFGNSGDVPSKRLRF
jgi:uncharacterized protein YegP (UPF0339 family)